MSTSADLQYDLEETLRESYKFEACAGIIFVVKYLQAVSTGNLKFDSNRQVLATGAVPDLLTDTYIFTLSLVYYLRL